jgi:hypothetical protein
MEKLKFVLRNLLKSKVAMSSVAVILIALGVNERDVVTIVNIVLSLFVLIMPDQ